MIAEKLREQVDEDEAAAFLSGLTYLTDVPTGGPDVGYD